jgi:hypothetical protein
VIFLYGGLVSEKLGHPLPFFILLQHHCSSETSTAHAYFQKKVRCWHGVFWGMLVPFIIWAIATIEGICFPPSQRTLRSRYVFDTAIRPRAVGRSEYAILVASAM